MAGRGRGPGLRRQRVLISGTYDEVTADMATFVKTLGHEARTVRTAGQVIAESVAFREQALIIEVQTETGDSAADVIRAVRLLPECKSIPVLIYNYYRISDLGSDDFRRRILNIESAKDACIAARATENLDRYNPALFQEMIVKYL